MPDRVEGAGQLVHEVELDPGPCGAEGLDDEAQGGTMRGSRSHQRHGDLATVDDADDLLGPHRPAPGQEHGSGTDGAVPARTGVDGTP